MNCEDFQILLNRDLDGILGDPDTARLAAHANQCARCANASTSQRAIHAAFRDLRHADVPPGLAEQIVARATAPRAPVVRFPRQWLVPAAAAVLALCLISGAVGFRIREPASVQAAPELDRKDEATYHAFLANQLGLADERIAAILAVRRETSDKLKNVDVEAREKRERLLRSEIEAIWKLLPAATREKHPELDPSHGGQHQESAPR